jgi:TfoX/Sxy family transcriptional regulator of competence genes
MVVNEKLADRVREALAELPDVEEKKMFSGMFFMVNGKMCLSVCEHELMCRIDPAVYDEVRDRDGVRDTTRSGKVKRGFLYVDENELKTKKGLDYWIKLCLDYNPKAKQAKKKK